MSTKKRTVIGTVNLIYKENGEIESAGFYPKISVTKADVERELGTCKNKTIEEIKKCAELLLASFFSKVSDIELRDMETTEIEAEVVHGEKFDNGNIKDIEFEFVYLQK